MFGRDRWEALQLAVKDLSWLLSRGYARPSAVKVVGDRYNLEQRQRMAVTRAACTDAARARRRRHEVDASAVRGTQLMVDGYNVLTTVEAALSGGVILKCRDGAIRDIASIHGTYRKVDETPAALDLIGRQLIDLGAGGCTFLLDAPVSNSGRLKALALDHFRERRWNWEIEIVPNPDALLAEAREIVATADSVILDRCESWFNLAGAIVAGVVPAELIDFTEGLI